MEEKQRLDLARDVPVAPSYCCSETEARGSSDSCPSHGGRRSMKALMGRR